MTCDTYLAALERARAKLAQRDPIRAARNADVPYAAQPGVFQVEFWQDIYHIAHETGEAIRAASGTPAEIELSILMLHYLVTADGVPAQRRWVAFRELPSGMLYDSAFQADVRRTVAARFGCDLAAFVAAGTALGGQRLEYGDASFRFAILPRLDAAVVLSIADDEFPAQARILYDASAAHYLPLEDLAVLGEVIGRRFVEQAEAS